MSKIRKCPFCKSSMIGNTSKHMERCSLEDATIKLTLLKEEDYLIVTQSSISEVKGALTFIDYYDRADIKTRNKMFSCKGCYCSVICSDDIPYLCMECGDKMIGAHILIRNVR